MSSLKIFASARLMCRFRRGDERVGRFSIDRRTPRGDASIVLEREGVLSVTAGMLLEGLRPLDGVILSIGVDGGSMDTTGDDRVGRDGGGVVERDVRNLL